MQYEPDLIALVEVVCTGISTSRRAHPGPPTRRMSAETRQPASTLQVLQVPSR